MEERGSHEESDSLILKLDDGGKHLTWLFTPTTLPMLLPHPHLSPQFKLQRILT